MRKVVVIAKNVSADDCYCVRVIDADTNDVLHYGDVFLWGRFDDGDCTWQKARALAGKQAKELAAKFSCHIEH